MHLNWEVNADTHSRYPDTDSIRVPTLTLTRFALYFVPMVSLFFYPYNRSPVVGLALSIAFQLCMLLAAYNAEVALVGLRRKVRTVG